MGLDAAGARVRLDRSAVERILVNLVSNALHASSPGAAVRVTTATIDGADGRWAVLRVADEGHGIDEETRPLLFEPYFTTRRGGGGCGLGLATVHALVHGAGGFIDVDSEPGRGTTVAIHLPVAVDRERESCSPRRVSPTRRLRIWHHRRGGVRLLRDRIARERVLLGRKHWRAGFRVPLGIGTI